MLGLGFHNHTVTQLIGNFFYTAFFIARHTKGSDTNPVPEP